MNHMDMVVFETGSAKWVHKHSLAQVIWTSNRYQALVLPEAKAQEFIRDHCSPFLARTVVCHSSDTYGPHDKESES